MGASLWIRDPFLAFFLLIKGLQHMSSRSLLLVIMVMGAATASAVRSSSHQDMRLDSVLASLKGGSPQTSRGEGSCSEFNEYFCDEERAETGDICSTCTIENYETVQQAIPGQAHVNESGGLQPCGALVPGVCGFGFRNQEIVYVCYPLADPPNPPLDYCDSYQYQVYDQ